MAKKLTPEVKCSAVIDHLVDGEWIERPCSRWAVMRERCLPRRLPRYHRRHPRVEPARREAGRGRKRPWHDEKAVCTQHSSEARDARYEITRAHWNAERKAEAERLKAKRRLTAAAADLLAVCEGIEALSPTILLGLGLRKRLEAAIAKAKGEWPS